MNRQSNVSSRKSHLTQDSCVDPRALVNLSLDSYDSDDSDLFNVRKVVISNKNKVNYPKVDAK